MTLFHHPDSPMCHRHPLHRKPCAMCAPLEPFVEVRTTKCRSGSDGECFWEQCPQLRDGEPERSGRDCPLWKELL